MLSCHCFLETFEKGALKTPCKVVYNANQNSLFGAALPEGHKASFSEINMSTYYLPASKASREVENFDWKKNPHTLVYGVKEFVTLSVCLSVTNFDLNYLRTGKTECAKKIFF